MHNVSGFSVCVRSTLVILTNRETSYSKSPHLWMTMLLLFVTCSRVAVNKKNLLTLSQSPPEDNEVHCSDSRPLRSTQSVVGNARDRDDVAEGI